MADEVLENLLQVSPSRFEVIVLDVLHRPGYGGHRDDLQRVGGTGDGGIDGVISLDKLGLEKVYVQAKRWQNTVGEARITGILRRTGWAKRRNVGCLLPLLDLRLRRVTLLNPSRVWCWLMGNAWCT